MANSGQTQSYTFYFWSSRIRCAHTMFRPHLCSTMFRPHLCLCTTMTRTSVRLGFNHVSKLCSTERAAQLTGTMGRTTSVCSTEFGQNLSWTPQPGLILLPVYDAGKNMRLWRCMWWMLTSQWYILERLSEQVCWFKNTHFVTPSNLYSFWRELPQASNYGKRTLTATVWESKIGTPGRR